CCLSAPEPYCQLRIVFGASDGRHGWRIHGQGGMGHIPPIDCTGATPGHRTDWFRYRPYRPTSATTTLPHDSGTVWASQTVLCVSACLSAKRPSLECFTTTHPPASAL